MRFFYTFLQQGIPESPTKSSFATVTGQNAMADRTEHSFAKGNNATVTGVGGLDSKDVPQDKKMPMIFSHRFSVFAEKHPVSASWMILLMWFSPEAECRCENHIGFQDDPKLKR